VERLTRRQTQLFKHEDAKCPNCKGTGRKGASVGDPGWMEKCFWCNGTGWEDRYEPDQADIPF
jgi:hypothetical protein